MTCVPPPVSLVRDETGPASSSVLFVRDETRSGPSRRRGTVPVVWIAASEIARHRRVSFFWLCRFRFHHAHVWFPPERSCFNSGPPCRRRTGDYATEKRSDFLRLDRPNSFLRSKHAVRTDPFSSTSPIFDLGSRITACW